MFIIYSGRAGFGTPNTIYTSRVFNLCCLNSHLYYDRQRGAKWVFLVINYTWKCKRSESIEMHTSYLFILSQRVFGLDK